MNKLSDKALEEARRLDDYLGHISKNSIILRECVEALDAKDRQIAELKQQQETASHNAKHYANMTCELEKELQKYKDVVGDQANDEGLWFDAQTAPEAYLQRKLRELHAAIEGESE